MKVYWTYRNQWKTIKVIHFGFNISGCVESCHYGISISLLFITIGVQMYKPRIDIDDPKAPWNWRK
jgi:hypothetical protein